MFGTFGFSYIGLAYLLCLFLPNILYSRRLPLDPVAVEENRALLLLERAGQVSCTVLVLIFRDFDPRWQGAWTLWLAASVLCMALYLACWVRYFTGGRRSVDFCRPFLGVPVPLAVLPVAAFLLLAVYGRVVWLGLAALILGVGHIGVTLQYWNQVKMRSPADH